MRSEIQNDMDNEVDKCGTMLGHAGVIAYLCPTNNGTSIMARPVSITQQQILAAALGIVRNEGPQALTARNLSSALGCGANAIFNAYGSMGGVLEAVREEARRRFRERVKAGFALNPPFKGFGMAFLWFAMDEPQLFKLIMEKTAEPASFEAYLDEHIGFKEECLSAIDQAFKLRGKDAEMLYYQLLLVAVGLARTCVDGGAPLSISQVSGIFGKNVRAFLMVIRAGADSVESFMPHVGAGPDVDVESYLMIRPLTGQNHLLQELHETPRYVRDNEWKELERVLRNSAGITPEQLREEHPNLTPGDIRVWLLERLDFSVAEQAVLLGISAPSVTKARQRMKAHYSHQSGRE